MTPPFRSRRTPLVLLAITVVATGMIVAGVVTVASNSSPAGGSRAAAPRAYVGSLPAAGLTIPSFALVDDSGVVVRPDAHAGKPLVVMFVDTHCTTSCPIIATNVARGIDLLPPQDQRRVTALAISVDPEHDTPATIRAFLDHNRATGRIRFLNGPLSTMRPLWKAFGILSAADSADVNTHTSAVFVYDRHHVWVDTLSPDQGLTPANVANDLRAALRTR